MDIERLVEDGARAKAYHHFNRRQWFGYCPKEARTLWLVDKYWRQFVPDARAVLAIALAAAAEEALMVFADRNMRTIYGPLGEQTAMMVADRLRTLATQLGAANG